MIPDDAIHTTTELAKTLDTYGPWAVAALFSVAFSIIAFQYRAARDRSDAAIAQLNEIHRSTVERLHLQQHNAVTETMRDLTAMLKEQTVAMTESNAASDRVTDAVQAVERRLEILEKR